MVVDKLIRRFVYGVMLVVSSTFGTAEAQSPSLVERIAEGDLIFQASRSTQADTLRIVTGSPLTHMGLIVRDGAGWAVLEASATVRLTPLDTWIASGIDGAVAVKRLPDLSDEVLARVVAAAQTMVGRPYDPLFRWDDSAIYCSELVYDAFLAAAGLEIGAPQPLGSFDLTSSEARAMFLDRVGIDPDSPLAAPLLAEPVISPMSMYRHQGLITIWDDFAL